MLAVQPWTGLSAIEKTEHIRARARIDYPHIFQVPGRSHHLNMLRCLLMSEGLNDNAAQRQLT